MSAALLMAIDTVAVCGAFLVAAWLASLALDAILRMLTRVLVVVACADYAARNRWARAPLKRWLERRG